jgi:hypothetical protein
VFCSLVLLSGMQIGSLLRCILSTVKLRSLKYFSSLSHKRRDCRKRGITHKMCVLISSTESVWNISHSKKNSARYHRYKYLFLYGTYYDCQIEMKPELSRQVFGKYWIIKFHENPSSDRFPYRLMDRRRDRHDEPNSCFSRFCERA